MYKLSLKLSRNNPFQNQTMFWYPIIVTSDENLISLNISAKRNSESLTQFYDKGYVLSDYELDKENICFFYCGNKIDKLIDNFGEKPFITHNGTVDYYFSKIELNSIYKTIVGMSESEEPAVEIFEYYIVDELKEIFGEEWKIHISEVKDSDFSTNLISLHPIIQLINHTDYQRFGKSYYKEFILYLLHKDFLVSWINSDDIPTNLCIDILNKYNELSHENRNEYYLKKIIEKVVTDLFNKLEIFQIVFLATQCGSDNSILKVMINNLYCILPPKKQDYINAGCITFQPKFIVKSVELHFIKMMDSEFQAIQTYEWLTGISEKVKFYDVTQHKILDDEELIHKAMKKHQVDKRYRFISEISITPPIDYTELHLKVSEVTDAIIVIINKNSGLFLNRYVSLKEIWVKKIGLEIFTPPQFGESVLYSLSQRWMITHIEERISNESGIKTMFINLYCDYPVFINNEFLFSFNYIRDIQYVYAILNEELKHNYNFDKFSSNFLKEK